MKSLFEASLNLAGTVMDMQLQRQNVVMSNIANVKTPKYRPMDLDFEGELQSALGRDVKGKVQRTLPQHFPSTFDPATFSGDLEHEFKPRAIFGEDRVNIDKEMAKMAKVQLQYSTLTTIVTKGYEGLNNVIQEGSK